MMGLATRLGSVINISIVKELGPVLAATMLAGRVGSSMAAELGTMRVTEQIDALSALGTNPIYYLVVPRFLACFLLIPLLTLDGRLHGRDRRGVVSTQILNVDSFAYWKHYARFRRQPRHLRRRVQELFLRGGDCPDQLPPRVQLAGGAEGVGGPPPRRSSSRSSPSCSSTSCIGLGWNNVYRQLWPQSRRIAMNPGQRRHATGETEDLIELRDVSMRFRQQAVLRDINLSIQPRGDRLHHRRERLRQDGDAQADDRPA